MKKILIAEDELITARLLNTVLARNGYDTLSVVSRGELIKESVLNNTPDLIVMDVGLQGDIDGIDALKEIREFSEIPVIFVSGYKDSEIKKRIKDTSNVYYIGKPCEHEKLTEMIKGIFNNKVQNVNSTGI